MRNAVVFIIALLTISLVLFVSECAKHHDELPDYQPYTKRIQQIEEATR